MMIEKLNNRKMKKLISGKTQAIVTVSTFLVGFIVTIVGNYWYSYTTLSSIAPLVTLPSIILFLLIVRGYNERTREYNRFVDRH